MNKLDNLINIIEPIGKACINSKGSCIRCSNISDCNRLCDNNKPLELLNKMYIIKNLMERNDI